MIGTPQPSILRRRIPVRRPRNEPVLFNSYRLSPGRIIFSAGTGLPLDHRFSAEEQHDRGCYFSAPVDPVGDEVVGPAGPTTATRMDGFTDMMLEKTGLLGMIGKAERGPAAIESIRKHGAVYLMAVGGAAFLVSRAIRTSFRLMKAS